MSKLGKMIKYVALGAAAGAGTYYYLKNKNATVTVGDEADTTNSETAKDVMDFFTEKKEQIVNSREYIQLNQSAKEATSAIAKTVMEAATIIKEKAMEAKDGVGVVDEEEKDGAVDYSFEEFEEDANDEAEDDTNEEAPAAVEEAPAQESDAE